MRDNCATVGVEGGKVVVSWDGEAGRMMAIRFPPEVAELVGFDMIEAASYAQKGTPTIDIPQRSISMGKP